MHRARLPRELRARRPPPRPGIVEQLPASRLFESLDDTAAASQVLIVEVDFQLETREIHGYLGLVLDLGATERLVGLVDRYLESIGLTL